MKFTETPPPRPPSALSEAPQVLAEISRCVRVNAKSKASIQWLIGVLAHANDGHIRNKAALALGDLRIQEAVPIIVRLLSADVTVNNRGSLLFALLSLDYRNYLGIIAPQLGSGVFEVMEMALQLLEQLPHRLKARQTKDAIKQLEQLGTDSMNKGYIIHGIFLLKRVTYPQT